MTKIQVFLLIAIFVCLNMSGHLPWLLNHIWLRVAILIAIARGEAGWRELRDTMNFRERRMKLADICMRQYLASGVLASFSAEHDGAQHTHRVTLWKIGGKSYTLNMVRRNIELSHRQFTVTSLPEEALRALYQGRPECDPYVYTLLRLFFVKNTVNIHSRHHYPEPI